MKVCQNDTWEMRHRAGRERSSSEGPRGTEPGGTGKTKKGLF